MTNATYDYGDLRITMTSTFDWAWSDSGGGATRSLTCFQPRAQGNMKPLGTYANPAYGEITGKKATILVGANTKVSPSKPAVAKPIKYTEIYNDGGSGGRWDGTIWRPVPPSGYVAVGDVMVQGYGKPPSVDLVWCLRNDLVKNAPYAAESIWSDSASGASQDCSLWAPIPESAGTPGAESIPICANTFITNRGYSKADPGLAYVPVLKLPRQFNNFTDPTPEVTPKTIPSVGDQFKYQEQARVTLPFIAFLPNTDPRSIDMISNPFCSVSRAIAWYAEGVWVNGGSGDYERTKEITYGMSSTQSTEMTHSVGVEISASGGIKGVEYSVSLNYQFTYTNTSSFTEYSERKTTEKFTVPKDHATVLFSKHIWIKGERADGSAVLGVAEIVANDDIRFGGCPLK